jgi:hypothetical protein
MGASHLPIVRQRNRPAPQCAAPGDSWRPYASARGRIYRLQANRLLGLEARQIIDLPFRVLSPKKPVALTARLKRRRTDDFI